MLSGYHVSRRRFVSTAAAAPFVIGGAPGVLAQSASPAASPAASPVSGAVSITSEPWGKLDDLPVERFHLKNAKGMEVAILTYGGIVQSLMAPDRNGTFANVVLGFAKLEDYVAKSPYFGAIIGRYANRIAKGTFTLDGNTYHLAINNDPNSLHGGNRGFDKYVWDATPSQTADSASLMLSRTSPDDEEHFPGTLQVTVTYTLKNDNSLAIHYTATTDKDTIINLTNHSYFNLAGEGSGTVYAQQMQLMASHFTPTDATAIPTGQIAPVAGTPFDFTQPHAIGERIRDGSSEQLLFGHGYDHNWVLDRPGPDDKSLIVAAKTADPTSGRVLTTQTTEPGVQLYTGNFLDGSFAGTSNKIYRQGDAFTLETQHFPDSPNEPKFPSTTLKPGETFDSTTIYTFSTQ
jgi:aldose 1-epimerase